MEKGKKTHEEGNECPDQTIVNSEAISETGHESHGNGIPLKEAGHESPESRVNSEAISEQMNDKESISSVPDSTVGKEDDKREVEADGNETNEVEANADLTGSTNLQGEEEEEEGDCSQYKGTVYQKNGHWGAQLYYNSERIWLGTFKNRKEAAKSYCRADLKIKGQLGHIEFSEAEKQFQDSLTSAQVTNFIKEHIYDRELQKWCNAYQVVSGNEGEMGKNEIEGGPMIDRKYLFEKKMTPSDVGQLNRLVIPKQHAVRHFPKERLACESETMLTFVDTSDGNEWSFRFSYWDSSQSYVLTKGWRKFIKSKGLKAGDVVSFYRDNEMPNNRFYITVNVPQNLVRDNGVQDQPGCDKLLQAKGSDFASSSQSLISVSTKKPKELMKSHGKRIVDENRDQKTSNHFHGSLQLGKRRAVEDEGENKSDDVIKLFGVEIGRKGKKLKASGVEIDRKGKGKLIETSDLSI